MNDNGNFWSFLIGVSAATTLFMIIIAVLVSGIISHQCDSNTLFVIGGNSHPAIDDRYEDYFDFSIGQLVIGTTDSKLIGYVVAINDDVVWIETGGYGAYNIKANGKMWFKPAIMSVDYEHHEITNDAGHIFVDNESVYMSVRPHTMGSGYDTRCLLINDTFEDVVE